MKKHRDVFDSVHQPASDTERKKMNLLKIKRRTKTKEYQIPFLGFKYAPKC